MAINNEYWNTMLKPFWNDIPIGKENAITYTELIVRWNMSERAVRKMLQDLSAYDNGDEYILIRSAKNRGGFYRTNNEHEINAFRTECLHKGKSIFAPVRKINRILHDAGQIEIFDILNGDLY